MTLKEQSSSDITKLSSNELSNKGFDSTFPRTDTVIQSNTRSTNHEKSNRNSVASTKSYLSECSSQSKTGKIMTAFEKMMTSGNTSKNITACQT